MPDQTKSTEPSAWDLLGLAADETRDETTSAAPMVAEDGNASERPNAGQETAAEDAPVVLAEHYRILAAELGQAAKAAIARANAAEVAAHNVGNRAASWWEAAKHWCREERDGDRHRAKWAKEAGEQRRRADAAEAKLAESERIRIARTAELETSKKVRAAHVAEIRRVTAERDEALAKLDEILRLLTGYDDDEMPTSIVAKIRTIANPEATR